jgi:predicted Zn-dependent peptidase
MSTIAVSQLDNGITVVSDRMDQVETASLGVWVAVGTRYESLEANGVSHMLEHMAFKGTQRRSARRIAEEIEAVGGHLNAYTGRESTAYYAKVLKQDVPLALDLIADILQNSLFAEEELAREREVVLQEIGQAQDTPDDIIFDHFQATAFPDQALGRPVLGTPPSVMALGRGTLLSHMARHYSGQRCILAAAGHLDHGELVDRAESLFARVSKGLPETPQPGLYSGGEFRGDDELEQVHLAIGMPGLPLRHPDQYAMAVMSTILGGGMSSRLFQEIREKRGLVYSIQSFHSGFADCGVFGVYAGTGEASLPELPPLIFEQLHAVAKQVTPEELARAKALLKADILMSLESTGARAEQLARQMSVYGRILALTEIIAEIEAVDEAALRRCAELVARGPLTVAALGPTRKLESYGRMTARLATRS